MTKLRLIACIFSAGMPVLGAGAVSAQDYPNKLLRIVTSAAGGSGDFVARLIAQRISGPLGQRVIVDNLRSGVIPGQIVSTASPDGYTLLANGGNLWIGPFLEKTPYDPVKDFSPISLTNRAPNILVVHPSLPVKTVKELIALAKSRPGALNYASGSIGGANHLAAELFKAMAGVNIVHIPYKDTGAGLNDLIAGRVQVMFPTPSAVAPHVKSGRLRALAVTSAEPSALFPGLPTIAASGVPGYESVTMFGIFAPAKTPDGIIRRLNQEIVRVLNMPDVKEKFFGAGIEAIGSSPEEFAAKIKSEMARLGKVIKDAGIRVE